MKGVEIDFVVQDCLTALDLYKTIFEVEVIEATALEKGTNEAVFSIYGTKFHMLDENSEFGLLAPNENQQMPFWFNITLEDIKGVYNSAVNNGCIGIQPVTYIEDFKVSNAIFRDSFGYIWMLHEVHKEVSFEQRIKVFENKKS